MAISFGRQWYAPSKREHTYTQEEVERLLEEEREIVIEKCALECEMAAIKAVATYLPQSDAWTGVIEETVRESAVRTCYTLAKNIRRLAHA